MGWYENKDFIRQLPIHAGRGHRIFPDYALHYENKPDEEKSKVLIEAKLYMKNNQEIEEAFCKLAHTLNCWSHLLLSCVTNIIYLYMKGAIF